MSSPSSQPATDSSASSALAKPVTSLKGVGPALAEKLIRLNIYTVFDLLFHLPLRYQDRTRLTPIGSMQHGDDVVIEGSIAGASVVFGRRRSLLVKVIDGTGTTALRFFHFSGTQQRSLATGSRIRCFGEVRRGASGLEMYHPEYRILSDDSLLPLEDSLTPIYPATEGVQQARLRGLIDQAFIRLHKEARLDDYLPQALSGTMSFMPLAKALDTLHHPPPDITLATLQEGRHPAQVRLAFEELLAHYLSLRQLRDQSRQDPAPALPQHGNYISQLLDSLPFALTAAQERVSREIARDLSYARPMLRLLQGDVGSGKTLIAVLAALQVIENGFQAVVMAPTEILAEQHFQNISQWLAPLGIACAFLSGKIKGKNRDAALRDIRNARASLIVGTHALFQESVSFRQLGLLVIDEQHRFGVHQRLALREKGVHGGLVPHQLIMTATPIPRTLTMSAYADLDTSVIDELPPGRTPINTVVLPDSRRADIMHRIHEACRSGRQAYWVCTLIEESELLQCQAAEATHTELSQLLADLDIGLVHGRMKPAEKTAVMNRFKAGELHLLVATTVIEVGVDVPNASLMIIENPERLGLAQLHQLRGRVGRGTADSHCILLYHAPLSDIGQRRLAIMRESNDGFFIAEEDLKLRGPGEILGTRQTGLMDYRIADLVRDSHLQPAVKEWAEILRRDHPERVPLLIRRWLAENQRYGNV